MQPAQWENLLQDLWQEMLNEIARDFSQVELRQNWLESARKQRAEHGPGVLFCSKFAKDVLIGKVEPATTYFPLQKLRETIPGSYDQLQVAEGVSYLVLALIISGTDRHFDPEHVYPKARIFSSVFELTPEKIVLQNKLYIDKVTLSD